MTLRRISRLATNTRALMPNTTQIRQCGIPSTAFGEERTRIHVVVSQCRDASTPTATSDVPVMVLVKAILECILMMIYNNVLSMHGRGGAGWDVDEPRNFGDV